MARNNDIAQLRAVARAKHRAVTKKVSRLKTQKDVEVSGTSFDPRRDPSLIKKYNATQLRTYIGQLEQFTSRRTQYVPDKSHRPIPIAKWRSYKAFENRYNQQIAQDFSKIKDIVITMTGETIEQRHAKMTPTHPEMTNPSVNAPNRPIKRRSRSVTSIKALDELTREMAERATPEFTAKKIGEAREQFAKMANTINSPDLTRAVNALTDEQFSVLWNYTPFITAAGHQYDVMRDSLNNKEIQAYRSEQLETMVKQSHALINWAKTLRVGS